MEVIIIDNNINKFIEVISKKYSNKCNIDYDDLYQDLFLEYYKIINKPTFLKKKTDCNFNESSYIYKSLTNKCKQIIKTKLVIKENELLYIDTTDEDYIDSLYINNNYNDYSSSIYNIYNALDTLDDISRRYVITLGYLKSDLTFLEDDFKELTKDCTKEELRIIIDKPTDKNIAKYILKSDPRQVKYIRTKLRNNKKFLSFLKKV